MKRIAMMAIVLVAAIGLLSAAEGSWSLGDGTLSADTTNQAATMNVSLNLSGKDDNQETETVTIGFSDEPVTKGEDVPSVSASAILTDNGSMQGTLSGDNVRYIFWKIASPSALKIWLDYPGEMSGSNEKNKLDWTITTTATTGANNGTAISEESTKEENGYLVLDRSNTSNFSYGTVGYQQLNITTASYAEAAIDNYSATLTLKVASV